MSVQQSAYHDTKKNGEIGDRSGCRYKHAAKLSMNQHRTHFVGTSRRVYSQLHVEITASRSASAGRTLSKKSCVPGWETSSTLSSKLGMSHDVSVPAMYTGAYGLSPSACCVLRPLGRGGIGGAPAPTLGWNGGMDGLNGLAMALRKERDGRTTTVAISVLCYRSDRALAREI